MLPCATIGFMIEADRSMVLQLLAESAASFEATARAASPASWLTPSAEGGWSPAQITEHLVLTERSLLVLLRRKLLQTPEIESTAEQRGLDEVVLQRISRRDGGAQRVEAPEAVRPAKGYGTVDEGMATFRTARNATLDYVRTTEANLRAHRLPHPAAGDLDGVQWLIFLAAHCERHARQLQQASGAAG